ncbi:hypothetical protein DUHN55_14630 [Helicobacter pylori]
MATISHRELRNDSSDVLRRVAAGEAMTVTNRGEVVARLVPAGSTGWQEALEAGQVRRATGPRDFSRVRRVSGPSTADVLRDLRGDR